MVRRSILQNSVQGKDEGNSGGDNETSWSSFLHDQIQTDIPLQTQPNIDNYQGNDGASLKLFALKVPHSQNTISN